MSLDTIGFYTLSEKRALNASAVSPMQRCEMILTDRCNFKCPYCRGLRNDCKGDLPLDEAKETLHLWCQSGLQNVRFSGGEPLTYAGLDELVFLAKIWGVRRIAISSNGSFPLSRYNELIDLGVNDFSISLDACCSALGDRMAGVSGSGSGSRPTSARSPSAFTRRWAWCSPRRRNRKSARSSSSPTAWAWPTSASSRPPKRAT